MWIDTARVLCLKLKDLFDINVKAGEVFAENELKYTWQHKYKVVPTRGCKGSVLRA